MSLVDITFAPPDPKIAAILEAIAAARGVPTATPLSPQRLSRGVYQITHWNFEEFLPQRLSYEAMYCTVKAPPPHFEFDAYGVCDSPEQFMASVGKALEADKRQFVASLVRISADAEGGWRWKKWGPYVGDGKPTTEYIADEPILRTVYTYHFYEVHL